MRSLPLVAALAACVSSTTATGASPPLSLLIAPATAVDARAMLDVVLPAVLLDLGLGLDAVAAPACVVEFALIDDWRAYHLTPAAERATVAVVKPQDASVVATATTGAAAAEPLHVLVTAQGLLGLGFVLQDFREHILLRSLPRDASSAAWRAAVLSFARRAPPTPNFALRTWSEEGQLLALPDRGYYTQDGLAANVSVLASECAALEAEVVPALLRLKMNALIVLHSDLEDYVTYDSLPSFLPSAPVIYNSSDPHRVRRAGIIGVMAPWIAHLADAFGLAFYFQVYELSSPPGVCSALLNCTLTSPATRALLEAKYSEVKSALPALTGIFVTVEDSWTPRAGYEFNVLWSGQAKLPAVVTLFHDAVVGVAGLRMLFRLWLFGEAVDWPLLRNNTPADVEFSVKQTSGDFLLDYPLNDLLKCSDGDCPPSDKRMIVEVDAFRQYNGWTSGLCYMGAQWAPRLAVAAAAGAADVWGWGSWAPGCTWPDSGPSLINATHGEFKSWRSWWNSFRVFNGTSTNGGFAIGAQANAYLLSRLSWDALPANEAQVALDFGTLFYGAENAQAVAALLGASLPAWLQTSFPQAVGDFTLFWTMMQHDLGTFGGLAAKNVTTAQFQAAAAASAAAVGQMEAALAAVDPAAVPASNPHGFAGAVRAVALSKAYLAAAFAWRLAGLSVALLGARPPADACALARGALASMSTAVAAFDASFPLESAAWVVGRLDPALFSAPSFLTTTSERTMAGFEAPWGASIAAVCPVPAGTGSD